MSDQKPNIIFILTDDLGYGDCSCYGQETDGLSILPLLNGDQVQQKVHEYLYFEYRDQLAVRKGNWKYYQSDQGEEALFNLKEDRHEDNDIKQANQDIFADLKSCVARAHQDYTPLPTPVYYDP